MKLMLRIVGVAAIIIGAIWILQGYRIMPGSFMTGDLKWAGIGAALALVGAIVLIAGWERRPR